MSPRPPMSGSFSDDLYAELRPFAAADEANDWHLAHYIAAYGLPHQLVEDTARDTIRGPGWSQIMDIDRTPVEWLGWLGQFVGVAVEPRALSESVADWAQHQRERIRLPVGLRRGSPLAITLVARRFLTGLRRVDIEERLGDDAYAMRVRTRISETPDPVATEAAIRAQKPAGIILTYNTYTGWTYSAAESTYATYADIEAAFATYADADANEP